MDDVLTTDRQTYDGTSVSRNAAAVERVSHIAEGQGLKVIATVRRVAQDEVTPIAVAHQRSHFKTIYETRGLV